MEREEPNDLVDVRIVLLLVNEDDRIWGSKDKEGRCHGLRNNWEKR